MFDVTNDSTIDLDLAQPAPTNSEPVSPLAVGHILRDRYVLEAPLGTKGNVFKALDLFRTTLPEAQQYVALKVLCAGGDCSREQLANLPFEFHCAQVLSHQNIVNAYELDRDGEIVFFTMELLDGEPLGHVIERMRPGTLQRSQAWQLIQQLGAGLAHAHERGVVHGDLKPRNILVTRDGELRILDFGAAHRFEASKSRAEQGHAPTYGTPAYASCEQLEGRVADPRDDLYALACICYELLTGSHPFGSRPATVARDYAVALARPPGLTGRQWRALQKGLSWHRAGRSISVRAWMHRLVANSVPHALTPLQDLAPERAASNMPWRAAAAAALVVVSLSALVFAQLKSSAVPKTVEPTPAATASLSQEAPAAMPTDELAEPTASSPLALPKEAAPDDAVAAQTGESKDAAAHAAASRLVAKATPLVISVEPSQVRADDHFAEIRLHRNVLQKNSAFTWWTEPATAKPGVDYVPETVAVQTFPDGFHSARLYVRLLPQSMRSQRSFFYVAIAQPGAHQAPGTVIRRQIWLPSASNLQAQR
jgi:eukaryotic-like serine/threonine-protein kinase